MPDDLTPEQRSYAMSRVPSRGNRTTERKLAAIFGEAELLGWHLHGDYPGRPDFVFEFERVAIFVDGCFWHGCPRCYRQPTTNAEYWTAKVARNRRRDRRVARQLRGAGWRVLRIWEHAISEPRTLSRVKRTIAESRANYVAVNP